MTRSSRRWKLSLRRPVTSELEIGAGPISAAGDPGSGFVNSGIHEFMAGRAAVCAAPWQGSGRPGLPRCCRGVFPGQELAPGIPERFIGPRQRLFNFGTHAGRGHALPFVNNPAPVESRPRWERP